MEGRAARASQTDGDPELAILVPPAVWSPARRGSLTCPPGLLCADSAGDWLCILSLGFAPESRKEGPRTF